MNKLPVTYVDINYALSANSKGGKYLDASYRHNSDDLSVDGVVSTARFALDCGVRRHYFRLRTAVALYVLGWGGLSA
jgi:hypothetical protein